MMKEIEREYIEQYKQHHSDTTKFPGNSYLSQHHLIAKLVKETDSKTCLLYTSPSPRDVEESRMPSSA